MEVVNCRLFDLPRSRYRALSRAAADLHAFFIQASGISSSLYAQDDENATQSDSNRNRRDFRRGSSFGRRLPITFACGLPKLVPLNMLKVFHLNGSPSSFKAGCLRIFTSSYEKLVEAPRWQESAQLSTSPLQEVCCVSTTLALSSTVRDLTTVVA
jgi:hypothetical protein